MRNHLSLVLVLLVVTISLNRGEKIKNERRAAGLLAYPRVGRTTGMTDFARIDRAMGLVKQPRNGRSGAASNIIRELNPDVEADPVEEVDADVDLDIVLDTDYPAPMSVQSGGSQGEHRIQYRNSFQMPQPIRGLYPIARIGRSQKTEGKESKISLANDAMWFGQHLGHSGHKEHHQERRHNGPIRLPWTIFFSPRELVGLQQRSHQQEDFALDREPDVSREKFSSYM